MATACIAAATVAIAFAMLFLKTDDVTCEERLGSSATDSVPGNTTDAQEAESEPVSVAVPSDVQPFEPLSLLGGDGSGEGEDAEGESGERPLEIGMPLLSSLDAAQDANQLIIVSVPDCSSTEGTFRMYSCDGMEWVEILDVPCFVGEEGVGQASAGVARTPTGLYSISMSFGNAPDPGCTGIEYIQVSPDLWWSGDDDVFYNRLISDEEVPDFDRSESEHLSAFGSVYDYCLDFGYNRECIPGAGAAFFIHCSENCPTGGCIAIDREHMETLMRKVHIDCPVIIDVESNIANY